MSTAMLIPLATGNRALTIGMFLAVVAVTLYITFWASRHSKTATDYYAGGRSFSGFQSGLAVSGDYMSAASFLGISGAIALYGYDGFLYSIGFLVAWLVALLLIAELLRNSGRFTMADQLAYRMRQTPVRSAAATSTIGRMDGAGLSFAVNCRPGTRGRESMPRLRSPLGLNERPGTPSATTGSAASSSESPSSRSRPSASSRPLE